jgi:pyridoxal phosphate enzyme (YggS family)
MPPLAALAGRLLDVRRRIDAAAHRPNRSPSSVTLVAVSKTFSALVVREAIAAGQIAFGENRVQEGIDKILELGDARAEWHLIGHLQSNKARKAAAHFSWIQSIDSSELARKVDQAAVETGRSLQVLVQVDLAGETTKFGVPEAQMRDVVDAVLDARALTLRGLMIVPPYRDNPEESRPWFVRLRTLRDGLVKGGVPAASLTDLSMGMSHDFEVAVEEGATIVRVGTAIFGERL